MQTQDIPEDIRHDDFLQPHEQVRVASEHHANTTPAPPLLNETCVVWCSVVLCSEVSVANSKNAKRWNKKGDLDRPYHPFAQKYYSLWSNRAGTDCCSKRATHAYAYHAHTHTRTHKKETQIHRHRHRHTHVPMAFLVALLSSQISVCARLRVSASARILVN